MSSSITYNRDGSASSFNGKEAVDVYRAAVLASSLGLLSHGICPTRGLTVTKALKMATEYTGVPYKGKKDLLRAKTDLKAHVQLAKAAIPAVTR